MGLRDALAAGLARAADLVRPAFAGTPYPSGATKAPEQLGAELGGSGTNLFAGFIRGEDPLAAMDGQTAIANLDEMRRSDSQVHASLEVVKQPIRAATYEVDAPDTTDEESVRMADFVRWNLFEGMDTSWDDVVRQALLMLDFGFMLFEKVWAVQEDGPWAGHIYLKRLAPRPPKTLWQWFTDEDGALLSVKQLAVKAGAYQFLDIPASKLVRFTFQQEGTNFTGISMLRSAYPHYVIKRQLYQIDAIRATRFGVGIPRAKLLAGYSPNAADRSALAQMLQGLSSHQHAFLVESPQFTVDILMPQGGSGTQTAVLPSIQHHNEQITRNILAQFLDMGGRSAGGSRALGASAMDFFLNATESLANQICDVIMKQVIRDLVDMNFDAGGIYPTLRVSGIQETDIKSLSAAASALAGVGLLTPNKKTENTFRTLMNLEEIPDEDDAMTDPGGAPVDGAVVEDGTDPSAAVGGVGGAPGGGPAPAAGPTAGQPRAPRRAVREPGNTDAPNVSARPAVGARPGQPAATSHDPRKSLPAATSVTRTQPARTTVTAPAAATTALADDETGPLPAVPAAIAPTATRTGYEVQQASAGRVDETRPDGTGVPPAKQRPRQDIPAVARQRPPNAQDPKASTRLPEATGQVPSLPERATMARSTTIASSGDADEEGSPSSGANSSGQRQRGGATFAHLAETAGAATARPQHPHALSTRKTRRPWTAPDGTTTFWRPPTDLETRVLDLRELPSRLRTARAGLAATLAGVREEQISRIASAVAHGKAGAPASPPLVGKLASDIAKAVRPVYDYGQQTVRDELRRQAKAGRQFAFAAPKTPDAAVKHLTASANVSAQQTSQRLLTAAQQEALRLERAGWEEDEIEDALVIFLGEESGAELARLAAWEVNEAFSIGRTAAADALKDSIDKATYSAILDENVCGPCEENDGVEVDVDSDEYDELSPPFSGCKGGDACRCVWIYTLSEDADVAFAERALGDGDWDESKHPREADGKFGAGGGDSGERGAATDGRSTPVVAPEEERPYATAPSSPSPDREVAYYAADLAPGTVVASSKYGQVEIVRGHSAPGKFDSKGETRYLGRKKNGENVGTFAHIHSAMDQLRRPPNPEMFHSGFLRDQVKWKFK